MPTVRSAARGDRTLPNGPRILARTAFGLLVVAIRRGERVARTLEFCGLGLTPRTAGHLLGTLAGCGPGERPDHAATDHRRPRGPGDGERSGAEVGPRELALAQLPFAAFALGLLSVNALSRDGEPLLVFGAAQVTDEGLTVGTSLALRTLVIGTLSVGFLASTDPVALMTSLQHQARLGPRVTYALLAGYRMLQDIPREWVTIRRAHATRVATRRDRNNPLPKGRRDLARAAFGLLVLAIRRGERVARTLESRGLGLTPRTTWRPRPTTVDRADWATVAAVVAVLAIVLTVGHLLGTLAGAATL